MLHIMDDPALLALVVESFKVGSMSVDDVVTDTALDEHCVAHVIQLLIAKKHISIYHKEIGIFFIPSTTQSSQQTQHKKPTARHKVRMQLQRKRNPNQRRRQRIK